MVSAMKIETDEVDEFTGKRTLITSWESICKSDIHIRFRMQNGVQRLDFKMVTRDGTVVGEGDKLLFKSTKDNNFHPFRLIPVLSEEGQSEWPQVKRGEYLLHIKETCLISLRM